MASLIGGNSNQIPTNGLLGELAFMNSSGITVQAIQSPVGIASTVGPDNFPTSGTVNNFTNLTLQPNSGNVIVGSGSSLGTTATNGFLCIPTCSGPPSGNPVGVPLGAAPLIYDTTNDRLYVRTPSGIWEYSLTIDVMVIPVGDEFSPLTAGTNKIRFRMPFAATLLAVRASVNTAPTGSALVVDINESGTTVLSTKLSIDASETTSTTAAVAAVISDSSLADDAEISIDIDQIGSTAAGAGLKVSLFVRRV